jgi:hypothetical protein
MADHVRRARTVRHRPAAISQGVKGVKGVCSPCILNPAHRRGLCKSPQD